MTHEDVKPQSFHGSPQEAMKAPEEEFLYLACLHEGTGVEKPDFLAVVDAERGEIVHELSMPNVGDELHHFGWNACSSALCPWAPHPHVERRYFLVPGLRSSRIHVVDVKDDPVNPKIVKVIEADDLASRTGYSRPHTIHCGPAGL